MADLQTHRLLASTASTNATLVKAGFVQLRKIVLLSQRASICYVKLYNSAADPPTEVLTPKRTIPVPAGSGIIEDFEGDGYDFGTGLAYRITTGSADNDTGAVAAGDIVGLNIDYK